MNLNHLTTVYLWWVWTTKHVFTLSLIYHSNFHIESNTASTVLSVNHQASVYTEFEPLVCAESQPPSKWLLSTESEQPVKFLNYQASICICPETELPVKCLHWVWIPRGDQVSTFSLSYQASVYTIFCKCIGNHQAGLYNESESPGKCLHYVWITMQMSTLIWITRQVSTWSLNLQVSAQSIR
jgi:hypothetical protein